MGAKADMLTVRELRDLRLGKLNTAVTDWREMVRRLRSIADPADFEGGGAGGGGGGGGGKGKGAVSAAGLSTAAGKAEWDGENAAVTKEFVSKTAVEMSEMTAEASDVLGILESAHRRFTKHKEDLETVIDDVKKQHIHINAQGTALEADGTAKADKPTQEQIDAAAKRIERVLWEAAESDRIAARELRAIAKRKHDFSGLNADSLKAADARQGEEDAAYWTKKLHDLGNHPEKLTEPQLKKFNEALRNQRDNPAFTTTFTQLMGGEGTLQFWRSLADPGKGDTPTGARAELLGHVQDNLSMTLANATRQQTPGMQAWEDDIIKAGSKDFGHPGIMSKVMGFQVMSNLMGKGKFDKGFLDRYGDAMLKYERGKGKGPEAWGLMGMGTDLDHSNDKSRGNDPMTGYLKALSHNPDASTAVFNDADKADYLLKERAYYDEDKLDSDGAPADQKLLSREALGDALFAAGSGMNPDDPTATYVDHRPEHKEVLNGALSRLADKGDDMPAAIRDDMARLLGNHGEDTHMTMGGLDKERVLDRDDLLAVSKQISRDPDSYQVLNQSMDRAMMQDINETTKVTEEQVPGDSLDRSGRTVGFLEQARRDAIGEKTAAELKDAGWGAKGMGGYLAVGTAASFLPWGGGHVDHAAFAVSKALVEDETERIQKNESTELKDIATSQNHRLSALKDHWYETNRDWAMADGDYSKGHGAMAKINAAAHDGTDDNKRESGDK
ncbi:hypothetical protein [Streptomyces sp. NPDC048172]|uniref:hypothetical protein n=1 Tax=Streptomyces sp. NPDC048172 TaxID=3365505 RepID=UPI0037146115